MKKLIVALALIFTAQTYSYGNSYIITNKTFDPHMVATSCGALVTYEDDGMTVDQQFDAAEMIEWFFCEGGNEIIWTQP